MHVPPEDVPLFAHRNNVPINLAFGVITFYSALILRTRFLISCFFSR